MTTNEILHELDLVDQQLAEATLSRLQERDRPEDEVIKEYERLTSKRLALYRELYNR